MTIIAQLCMQRYYRRHGKCNIICAPYNDKNNTWIFFLGTDVNDNDQGDDNDDGDNTICDNND